MITLKCSHDAKVPWAHFGYLWLNCGWMELTSHSDIYCLTLDETIAVVSCRVVSPSLALRDNKDFQLCSLEMPSFGPQTLLHVPSVSGKGDVTCAFRHRADKDQCLPFNHLPSAGRVSTETQDTGLPVWTGDSRWGLTLGNIRAEVVGITLKVTADGVGNFE